MEMFAIGLFVAGLLWILAPKILSRKPREIRLVARRISVNPEDQRAMSGVNADQLVGGLLYKGWSLHSVHVFDVLGLDRDDLGINVLWVLVR